jgi:hypothetical protein
MFSNIRNDWMQTTAKAGVAALITACIGAGTAAADDSWKLTVNNSGSVPLKVTILDQNGVDITADRSAEFIKGSGTVTVKKKGPYRWEVFAPGEREPCQKQRDVSSSSISVHCEAKAAAAPAPAKTAAAPTAPAPTPTPSSSSPPPPKLPPLQTDSTGCSLKDFTSHCPPKSVSADIRKRAEAIEADLARLETDVNALGPNDAEKFKGLIERYNTARAADELYRKDLDQQPGQPAELIEYKTKLSKKEQDLAATFKKKGEELCTPKVTKTSAGCEFVVSWLGGRK